MKKAFTLIEILVVIFIIAILLTIAVPVLHKSKEKGSDLLCANNLHQLSLAFEIYPQENKTYPYGFFDIIGHSNRLGDSAKDWQKGLWWFHFLEDTLGNVNAENSTLWCPSRRLTASGQLIAGNVLCSNYGVNYSICKITIPSSEEFSGAPLRPCRVRSPSSKLLVMDSGYALISWKALMPQTAVYQFENSDRQDSYYLPGLPSNQDCSINQDQQNDAVKGRHHSGLFNVIFADGHGGKKSPSSVAPIVDAVGNIPRNSSWSP